MRRLLPAELPILFVQLLPLLPPSSQFLPTLCTHCFLSSLPPPSSYPLYAPIASSPPSLLPVPTHSMHLLDFPCAPLSLLARTIEVSVRRKRLTSSMFGCAHCDIAAGRVACGCWCGHEVRMWYGTGCMAKAWTLSGAGMLKEAERGLKACSR